MIHEGMTAALAACNNDEPAYPEDLDIDYALISHRSEPHLLDEVLCDLNAKEWEKGLKYKIAQLKKLHTWVIEDLPDGQTVILCSKILREKHGPNGEVQTYRVCIVVGGHKQVERINYME